MPRPEHQDHLCSPHRTILPQAPPSAVGPGILNDMVHHTEVSPSAHQQEPEQWYTHLVALKRRVLLSILLPAWHAQLRRLHVNRVARKVRELVVRLREEQGRILPRCDAGKGEVSIRSTGNGKIVLEDFDPDERDIPCGLRRTLGLIRAKTEFACIGSVSGGNWSG
jgi:hypothetical protein